MGYRLHPLDVATNKPLAAAGRREVRDIIDLIFIHKNILPLGPIFWAATAKDQGYSPEGLVEDIRRHGFRHRQEEFDTIQSLPSPVAGEVARTLRSYLDEAEAFISGMPAVAPGSCLFIKDGQVVTPCPSRLSEYTIHNASRRGCWPSTIEVEQDSLRLPRP